MCYWDSSAPGESVEERLASFLAELDERVGGFESSLRAVGGPVPDAWGSPLELKALWLWFGETYIARGLLPIAAAGLVLEQPPWIPSSRIRPIPSEALAVAGGIGDALCQVLVHEFGDGVIRVGVDGRPTVGEWLAAPPAQVHGATMTAFRRWGNEPKNDKERRNLEGEVLSHVLDQAREQVAIFISDASCGSGVLEPPQLAVGGELDEGQVEIGLDERVSMDRRERFESLLREASELRGISPHEGDRAVLVATFHCTVAEAEVVVSQLWSQSN